jgi:uncharacterized protein YjbI with pentapeptide repeats
MNRDDFSPKIKEIVSKRAAYICSNPQCRRLTLSPSENDPEKFQLTGIVAHITAAAPKGPRYDESLTEEQRASADNGIYLCSTCATRIDKNLGIDYPVNLLREWKAKHEKWVTENLNRQFFEISQNEHEKRTLILQMGSPTNSFAVEAVRKLRAIGWLQDGALEGANLSGANLQNADLSDADLKGVDLSKANLQDVVFTQANLEDANMNKANLTRAKFSEVNLKNVNLAEANLQGVQDLTDKQLAKANSLLGATMASGRRYNGRFNLTDDIVTAHLMRIGRSDCAMANFYGVSIENYQWGQEWYQFSQSPPVMYNPNLEKWYRLNENPEGIYD